jgi:hypothetical protein
MQQKCEEHEHNRGKRRAKAARSPRAGTQEAMSLRAKAVDQARPGSRERNRSSISLDRNYFSQQLCRRRIILLARIAARHDRAGRPVPSDHPMQHKSRIAARQRDVAPPRPAG